MIADGGLVANNPTKYCLSEVQALWPNRPIGCIVSIGCGTEPARTREEASDEKGHEKGLLWWLSTIRTNALDDSSQRETERALQLFNPPGHPQPEYYRFDPEVTSLGVNSITVDEAWARTMREATAAYIDAPETSAQLKEAAASLLALARSRAGSMPREVPLSC